MKTNPAIENITALNSRAQNITIVYGWLRKRELDEGIEEDHYTRVKRLHDALAGGATLTPHQDALLRTVIAEHIEDVRDDLDDETSGDGEDRGAITAADLEYIRVHARSILAVLKSGARIVWPDGRYLDGDPATAYIDLGTELEGEVASLGLYSLDELGVIAALTDHDFAAAGTGGCVLTHT